MINLKITGREDLRNAVYKACDRVLVTDVHTHLFSPGFDDQLLWGFDELVNYHYLSAETMKKLDIPYEEFWAKSKRAQADLIWDTLFIKNSPYSEAARGVLSVLKGLGLDPGKRNPGEYREYFENLRVEEYIDIVFKTARVKGVVMTNDPFSPEERKVWMSGYVPDKRFMAALRLDTLLIQWDRDYVLLKDMGYDVGRALNEDTLGEIRRFLNEWIDRMGALYMACSLPPHFKMPDHSSRGIIIERCVLEVARERNIPFAMMIGAKKLTNPPLGTAGDSEGKGDIDTVEYLCRKYPHNKFLVTMLARENQHELTVAARKFRNLMVFGCWWFLNNPSLIEEMTKMRFELLGTQVIPQHSDARVLDQLIYKWDHSRKIIARILFEKYSDLADTGWIIQEEEITRDVENLFSNNFYEFLNRKF